MKGRTREALRLRAKRDSFALEHLTWFAIQDGDAKTAARNLRPFIDRSQHLAGRNLSNFLYGTLLLLRGNEQQAQRVFRALPDNERPRTWTLGSYLASGRLDDRDPEFQLRAFPWEKLVLASHRQLLESAGFTR